MASATAGSTPIDPPRRYYDNTILDASCISAALGKCTPERDTLSEIQHLDLTDQQKLMGHLHPDDICGTNAFDLAKRHSNAFMAICIMIVSLICDLKYPKSNFVVARIYQPLDHHANLKQTTRPKAANAKTMPPTTTYALLDKAPEAGRWIQITIIEGKLSYKFLDDQEVRDLDLVQRLQDLRGTAGTQPAQPARLGAAAAPPASQANTSQVTGSTSQAAGPSQPVVPMPTSLGQPQQAMTFDQTQLASEASLSDHEDIDTPQTVAADPSVPHFNALRSPSAAQGPPSSYGFPGTTINDSQSFSNGAGVSHIHTTFSPVPGAAQDTHATKYLQVLKRAHEESDDEEEAAGPVAKRSRRDPVPARAGSHASASVPRRTAALPARKKAHTEAMNPLLLDPTLGGSTQAPRMLAEPRKSKNAARRQRAQVHNTNSNAHLIEAVHRVGMSSPVPSRSMEQRYTYALPSHGVRLDNPLYVVVPHLTQAGFEQSEHHLTPI